MGEILNRFSGAENEGRLMSAVMSQALVIGKEALAKGIIEVGKLQEVANGEVIIEQGGWDDDIFMILAGEFQIAISGRPVALRQAGTHVGELTGISPSRPRTATVSAVGAGLVLRIRRADLEKITENDTDFWKRIANVVADRLDERNKGIGKANDIARVFVISSSEQTAVVDQVTLNLDSKSIAVDRWDKGTFGVSDYPISSLMDAIEASDFTISIVAPDDTLVMRGKSHNAARDNVHLEYGISLGVLGRRRSILLVCADTDIHLPSDTAGLTTLRYRNGDEDEMRRTVRNACIEARDHILEEGVFVDRPVR